MRKTIFLVAALVLLLGIPSIVGAKEEELKKATVDWVIDYVAEQIAGIGGEDFNLPSPEEWTTSAYTDNQGNNIIEISTTEPGACNWHGVSLSDIKAKATAYLPNSETHLGYALGSCENINFNQYVEGVDFPGPEETIPVNIYLFWMGKEKLATVNISVTKPPNNPPWCGFRVNSSSGNAPFDVQFTGDASDPDGDELSYSWDFDDGATASGELEVDHTYSVPGIYYPSFTVSDGELEYTYTSSFIEVN